VSPLGEAAHKQTRAICERLKTMIFSRIGRTVAVMALLSVFCFGQDSSSVKIVPYGFASMEWGQVVQGHNKYAAEISHVAFERIYLGTGLNIQLSENTKFTGRLDVKAFNEFPRLLNPGATRRYYYYFYLHQAELTHRFVNLFNIDGLQLNVGGGYFPYKYNSDTRNLGEYLFRSTAYPQTLTTEFDMPWARLAGLYGRFAYSAGIHKLGLDILADLNTEWMAIGDLNLTMIASYSYARLFEIGAGVQFASLISADESFTTPKNFYTQYVINANDTSHNYSFRGTKLMGRFSFDPKKFVPARDMFGEQDLKIYGEASLLGVKNYGVAQHSPVWYNSILERIPVMLGFNFPVFKFLDVLSLEGEWWGNRYPNSTEGIIWEGLPLPFIPSLGLTIDSTLYKNDNLKWSIFGAKTFAGHYRISFQAASDHMHTFAWDWNRFDGEECLRGPEKWSYVLKFGVLF
jgi:hypothetical protein